MCFVFGGSLWALAVPCLEHAASARFWPPAYWIRRSRCSVVLGSVKEHMNTVVLQQLVPKGYECLIFTSCGWWMVNGFCICLLWNYLFHHFRLFAQSIQLSVELFFWLLCYSFGKYYQCSIFGQNLFSFFEKLEWHLKPYSYL